MNKNNQMVNGNKRNSSRSNSPSPKRVCNEREYCYYFGKNADLFSNKKISVPNGWTVYQITNRESLQCMTSELLIEGECKIVKLVTL